VRLQSERKNLSDSLAKQIGWFNIQLVMIRYQIIILHSAEEDRVGLWMKS
jgi:hypothetical protein